MHNHLSRRITGLLRAFAVASLMTASCGSPERDKSIGAHQMALAAVPTKVQSAFATPQGSFASARAEFPRSQTAGNLNVVIVGLNSATSNVTSVTDSLGHSYRRAVGPVRGTALSQSIYYAANICSGANAVTATFDQNTPYPDIQIIEFSGLDTTDPLDGAAQSSGTSNLATSGTLTTSSPGGLIVAGGTTFTAFNAAGTGYTLVGITSPDNDIAEYTLAPQAGTFTATAPLTSGNWVFQAAGFRAAPTAANLISSSINDGATLSGSAITWTASPPGSPSQVDFYVDGTLKWTERVAVYQYNGDPDGRLDSTQLANGAHQLKVVASYASGAPATRVINVTVSNAAPAPTSTSTSTPPPPATSPPPTSPPPPSTTDDGSVNAPPGVAAQRPTLLDAYASSYRPPWRVAGVHYGVGPAATTVFKNPATDALPSGVTRDVGLKRFYVNANATLDGWNFTDWTVLVYGGTNVVVTNNDFTRGYLIWRHDGSATGGTIRYNKFDAQNANTSGAPFIIYKNGRYIVEYNWFNQSFHMHFQITNGTPDQSLLFRYNLLTNAGGGSQQGAHGDWIQLFGAYYVSDVRIDFNTSIQDIPSYATQGYSLNASNPTIHTGSISNNTMIVKTNTNTGIYLVPHWHESTFTIANNFVDPTSSGFRFTTLDTTWPGPYPGNVIVQTKNVNMLTGGGI